MTIGIEMGSTHIVTTVLDLSGVPRKQQVHLMGDTRPDALCAQLRIEIDRIKTEFDARLLGIGVVMPGPFGIEGMTSVGPTTLPGWAGIDAADVLSQAFAEPVIVENDANAAAVGERLFGAGRAVSNFAMIYFGAGIGLGMIQDGAPFRGAFGNAGEIGHISIVPAGGRAPVASMAAWKPIPRCMFSRKDYPMLGFSMSASTSFRNCCATKIPWSWIGSRTPRNISRR